ncbi:MAG: aspartate aminotransferase family protein [Candidatus Omnitrophica bacterium]|jgi:acetylornithine/N-succinyldiaminopimelate aminotransferase|nr:aspartate aminotransferase family protein [Candidatus Omnitrophota bacterium]
MKSEDIKKMFSSYSLNTYKRVGPVFVKGKGSFLWDSEGRKYLDLFPGWGVSILGHCHPQVVKVIKEQAAKLIHLPNNLYQEEQAILAKEVIKSTFPGKVFFANSGAEAIEAAIKLTRLYGNKTGRYEVITMKNSFHGRTFGALSATGQGKYKDPFKPILPEFKEAIFNDFESFKSQVNDKTVAVLLELIQGEGGINIASKEYVKNLKEFCKDHDLLFIADEVQTGMGRTGKLFCYQNYDITPDALVVSKGLGAGVPVSAIVVKNEIADLFKPGLHASTFGGSPLITKVTLEVFKIIKKDKILNNTIKMGSYLVKKLNKLKEKFAFIKEVRAMGLMTGVELSIDSFPIFMKALEKGLIINSTHQTVLRIMPALTVKKEEIDKGLEILEEVFSSHS